MNAYQIEKILKTLKRDKNGVLRGKNKAINELQRLHYKAIDEVDYHNLWSVSLVFQGEKERTLRVGHTVARSKEEAFGVVYMQAIKNEPALSVRMIVNKVIFKIRYPLKPTIES